MNKKYIGIGVIIIFIVAFLIVIFSIKKGDKSSGNKDIDIIDITIDPDNGDEKIDWNQYPTKSYELEDSIVLSEEGTYELTGTIKDGSITIQSNGNVRLILKEVSITNSKGPAIYVKKAEDVVIVTDSDSYLEDGKSYVGYDSEVIGVIYSSSDITFDGEGTLTLHSNSEDAIVGKDDLKVINGNYEIESIDDGIRGKDSVYIKNGTFKIVSGGDAIKSTNDKDSSKGFVLIENGNFDLTSSLDGIQAENKLVIQNGTFTISSGDDGIHADKEIIIDGGTIDIQKSYEGIEASKITINDGEIKVISSDDGMNVAGGNDSSAMGRPGANQYSSNDNVLTINGGDIYVDASGDGLDANGSIYINGGTIQVDGPENSGNGALDYDSECVIKGGILLAAGASGMAQNVSSNSTIYNVLINFSSTYGKEDKIVIVDSSDKEIISYQSNKNYSSLVVASSSLQKGDYKILINGEEYESFTISNITTQIGSSNGMNMGPGNKRPNEGMPGGRREENMGPRKPMRP